MQPIEFLLSDCGMSSDICICLETMYASILRSLPQ
jgi:hypothetical protein